MARNDYGSWAPYVPVAQRQHKAKQKAAALAKKGQVCQPVTIQGRAIAKSFWGKAWCDNLESYSDFANRLPRGRTYARNGSVIDLRIEPGKVHALVCGSELYSVEITVHPLEAKAWDAIMKECSGKVASVIELLQGRLSQAVMETVTRRGEGLFPQPTQISLRCNCPDAASMCKHVAATLYGIGARLDDEPELLFRLRHVEPTELIRQAADIPMMTPPDAQGVLDSADLSALFGIDLDDASAAPTALPLPAGAPSRKRSRKPQVVDPPAPPVSAKNRIAVAPRRAQGRAVTAGELISRGVARHMIQAWLASGVLLRTKQRGVYRTTAQTEARIVGYMARAPRSQAGE
ncbi:MULTISPECIES: hypothetical protein [unclassified Variovorax]|uniref:hypothetical protein n=1 Tax=unclassified Variovorax TaxID=663243 RepID=UPI001BD1FB91|nr:MULTISPECIES: hypothetical protein [unclassified Variovorax]